MTSENTEAVDENYICGIHLEAEITVNTSRGHAFCKGCIEEFLKSDVSYPLGRKCFKAANLTPVDILNTLMGKLFINCKFIDKGSKKSDIRSIQKHEKLCKDQSGSRIVCKTAS